MNILKHILKLPGTCTILLLGFYRNYLSALKIQCCKYYPSCSEYAILSISKHGLIVGGLKSAYRILRCNPLSKGGYDPA